MIAPSISFADVQNSRTRGLGSSKPSLDYGAYWSYSVLNDSRFAHVRLCSFLDHDLHGQIILIRHLGAPNLWKIQQSMAIKLSVGLKLDFQVSRNQFDSIIYRGCKRNELVHMLFALLSIQKLRFLKLIAYIMNGSFGKQHNRLSQALCWSPTTNFTSKFSVVRLGSGHAPGLLLFGLLCFYFLQ